MSKPTLLDMLRDRERVLEREFKTTRATCDKLLAAADARLTEVRELIERAETIERNPNV